MSQDPVKYSLPFVTRDHFAFEGGAAFSLVIKSQAIGSSPVTIRGATVEGPFVLQHIPNSNRTVKTESFRLPNVPIWVQASDDAGSYIRAEFYIQVALAINGDSLHQLLSGYVWASKSLTWPMTFTEPSTPPELGEISTATSANPAAGAELTHTVPANQLWLLESVVFTLVTDGTAANRRVHLVITDNNSNRLVCISSVDHPATTTNKYNCWPAKGLGTYSDNGEVIIPIPDGIWLESGSTLTTETTLLKAGDDYGTMKIRARVFMNDF